MIRIISGKWKGKRLNAPKNLPTRPTTDFAKEALFNILNHRFYLDEVNVLDLFAGIGSVSLEFASRHATLVHCVEQNQKCINFIQKTAESLDLNQISVFKYDVFKFLKKENHQQYDIIFADPPFDLPAEDYQLLISSIFENQFLDEGGMLILEHGRSHDFSHHNYFSDHKKYGNLHFSFFELNEEEE